MDRVRKSESGGKGGHGRMERRGLDALDYGVAIQEMQRKLEAMELELGDYRERSRRIEEGRMPKRHHDGRGVGHTRTLDVKVNVPVFDGKGGVENFLEWTQAVDRILELKEWDGREVVEVVAMSLRGYASMWWDYVKRERKVKGKEEVQTWRKMRRLLRERFMPSYLHTFQNSKPNPNNHPNPSNTTEPPTPLNDPKTPPPPPNRHLPTTNPNTSLPKCLITLVGEEVVELEDEVGEKPIVAESNLEEEKRGETKEVHTNLSTLFPLVLETEEGEEGNEIESITLEVVPFVEKDGTWRHKSVDSFMSLPYSLRGKHPNFMSKDRSFHIAQFMACSKDFDASHVIKWYFREVVNLHRFSNLHLRGTSVDIKNWVDKNRKCHEFAGGTFHEYNDEHVGDVGKSRTPREVKGSDNVCLNVGDAYKIAWPPDYRKYDVCVALRMTLLWMKLSRGEVKSSQAEGYDAGASLKLFITLKHKWKEKEVRSFSSQNVGGT